MGSAPEGTNAFIYSENFYYTPINCCDCPLPGSLYDGANCYVQAIPASRIGFIWSNDWYLYPLGDDRYPYDVIDGYTMAQLENDILPNAYGMTSLRTALMNNKPSGVTDKRINKYLDFYFNL